MEDTNTSQDQNCRDDKLGLEYHLEEDSVKHGQDDPRTQENRRKVLQFIPPKVQKEYREICFAKWCGYGYILTSTQVGPMDVHSTHV